MLEDFVRRPCYVDKFRKPPLGSEMDGYCKWLHHKRYSRSVICTRVSQVSHFSRFLYRIGIRDCGEVERIHGQRFLSNHLPRCRCCISGASIHAGIAFSVRSFMDYLSHRGILGPPPAQSGPAYRDLLDEYLRYLKEFRNLKKETVRGYRFYVTRFLMYLGPRATAGRIRTLDAQHVHDFFAEFAQRYKRSTRQQIRAALRSFFVFCRARGYIKADLAQALPRMHAYRLATVPRGIEDGDIQKVLECIDRTTDAGRRDFAIIQLLAGYGVRGAQVRTLFLKDILWGRSLIRFPSCKGGNALVLPLTDQIGESLVDYLRNARPGVPWREVFLTVRAPFHPFRRPSNITAVVAERMRRAEVTAHSLGSHAFRHAFATRMLRNGQSLKTIADMLGHRRMESSFIYTKVDFDGLRDVALDWPEV